MRIKHPIIGVLLTASISVASAANIDYGPFTLYFDETTILGSPSSSFSASGGQYGFAWTLPSGAAALSVGGVEASNDFTLPAFTVVANAGWSLGGPATSFMGNLVFNEVGAGATTSVTATATVSVDGGPDSPIGGPLDKVLVVEDTDLRIGYYAGASSYPLGSFSMLSVNAPVLSVSAGGGTFASVVVQPQNKLEYSFIAQAVPEPESWALMLAGLGVLGYAARRRQTGSA